ncbi:MAG TPA: hypothetical protein VGV14_08965, partial [Rhodanobacter sp.]|nr:hypothetical protein [Rhodanobacter sp.]
MHNTLPTIKSSRVALRKTGIAMSLTLACSLFAGGTQAQVLVTDVAGDASNAATQASTAASVLKQIAQYTLQAQQYASQIQQYEQMLTKIENLGSNFQLLPNSMAKIDADPLIQANCNGSSGSIVGNLLSSVTSLLKQSVAQSQQQICTQITTTQVDKYNTTVDMLGSLAANTSALQKLSDLTSSFTNAGESSSATTQAAGYSNQMATAMNDWEAHMKADDAIISSL